MGKQDVISKVYLGAADRIADLLNNEFFEGDSVVAASDITEMDSTAAKIIKAEDNVVNVRVVAKDLARKVWFGVQVMLFAIEAQSDIHYAMPLKVMSGDAALYDGQWKAVRRGHQRERDLGGAEYLSGFGRGDRLVPVITAVIYFGEEKWDGPVRLKEMMDLDMLPAEVSGKIADYPLHLIDVRRYPHVERFKTDLRLVFGFLQRASEPEELTGFIGENTKEFSSLTEDTYDMIAAMSGTGELEKLKKDVGQEAYDMCKAIDMMMQEREAYGILIGEERGIKMARSIFQMHIKGWDQNKIADELHITAEKVRSVLGGEEH